MQTTKQTILLVDDDRDLRETLAEGLEAAGYAVIQTDSIRSIMKHLSSMDISTVIMDLVLTGESGATLLGYLKAHPHLKTTKTIMISGFEHGSRIARLWGADRFLQKPVTISSLVSALKELAAPLE